MQLVPKINFVTCLYVHVENMAVYHKWSSKEYPALFSGSIDWQTAKKYTAWYKKFRREHFIDWLYEEAFTSGKLEDAMNNLKHLKKTEKQKLNEIFAYFTDSYQETWKKNKGNLKPMKKVIRLWWKKEKQKFIGKAQFITPNLPKKASVFLFWNPLEFKATALGRSGILIETNSNFPESRLLQTIPHELGHLIDISYGHDSLSLFKDHLGLKKGMIVHEAVIRALFPAPKSKGKITNIKNQTDIEIEKLSLKFRQVLKPHMSKGGDYHSFLLRLASDLV